MSVLFLSFFFILLLLQTTLTIVIKALLHPKPENERVFCQDYPLLLGSWHTWLLMQGEATSADTCHDRENVVLHHDSIGHD